MKRANVMVAKALTRAKQRRSETLREVRCSIIVEAAKTVFSRDGLQRASMRAIASEAGCTTGAIYPYFDGKEALYAAVLSQSLIALKDDVEQRIAGCDVPREAARAGLQGFFDFYRSNPDDLSLGLYLFGGIQRVGLTARLNKALNAQLRSVFALIEQQFESAGKNDPAAVTAQGIAQATGLLILDQTGRIDLFGKKAGNLFAEFVDSC